MTNVSDSVITKSVLDKALEKQSRIIVDEIAGIVNVFAAQIDNRFNKVAQDIAELKQSHDRLLNTIDGFIKRIDDYEKENVARDHQLARFERWIQQIAKETGVKLEM